MSAAYLGDEYSYSFLAAEKLIGGNLVPQPTLTKTLQKASVGGCDYAVAPLENNIEGIVNEVYDALFDSDLYINKQLVLPIRHSLIGFKGAKLSDIKKIVAHPQAIGQCRNFLSESGVTVEAESSTSAALNRVDSETAAIAAKGHADQIVLRRDIQDSALNATRFALLSKRKSDVGGTVSVAFDLLNKAGSLLGALTKLYSKGINLTRIVSRPKRDGSGNYRFFVDFDFDGDEKELNAVLSELGVSCEKLRFLGRYDVVG